jgi:aminomethyltransferase
VYTPLCYESGGIVDDVTIYCMGREDYLFVVNAANVEKDYRWLSDNAPAGVSVADESAATSQIAVQGPGAVAHACRLLGEELADLRRFRHTTVEYEGSPVLISRTGYTGEDGFEIYIPNSLAPVLWERLLKGSGGAEPQPVGLGARDTLRFEAGYRLYGNDLDETTNPLEAGLAWTVKLDKGEFIGRRALLELKERGLSRKFVGIELVGRRIARHGCRITAEGVDVGFVTSGTYAPFLEKSLAMGYLSSDLAVPGRRVEVNVKGAVVEGKVVKLPFLGRRGGAAKSGA